MPPTNMEASACTRTIGLSGSNQRGPGRLWIRSACLAPSGPATRRNSAFPSLPRPPAMSPSVRGGWGRLRSVTRPRLPDLVALDVHDLAQRVADLDEVRGV